MATAHDPVAEELWDEDLEIPDDGFLALPSGQRVLSKKMPANSSVPESHLTRLAGEMEPILPLDLLQPGQLGDQAERASLVTHAGSSADQPPECAVQLDPALLDGPRELGTANQSIVVNAPESRPSDSVIVVQGSAPSDDVTAPPSVSAAAETTAVTETGVVDSDISSITYVLHEEPPRLLSDDSCHNLDSAPILGPDLRSLRSSSSNFGDDIDIDFSDSVSLMGRPSSHQPLSDKQGSCASLDFLPDAVPDAPHTVAPHLLRRIMHSPAPSHGTAASNFDFEGDDLLADLEVPETFAPEGCLQRRLDLAFAEPDITEMSPESTAQRQESDLFDDLEVPEDAFALAAQRRNQQVFMDRNPSSPARSQSSAHLHTAQPIALSAVAIQVHEITELDEIEDLAVSMERETKFESVPRLPTLSKRSKSDAKDAAARGPSTPNGRRIEIRSSLTAPTASFLAKMREPVKINQSSKSPNRKPKRPELIQNLGSANTVKVIGEMRWNPILQKWEGNEEVLRDFDPPPPPLRPALITNFGASSRTPQTVGNMVWDPISMSWRGNEDDGLVFDGFDEDDDNHSMISVATGLTGIGGMRTFEISFGTKQGFMNAEREHVISTSRWYPQRQGHVPSLGSQRLATRLHLAEIRQLVPND